VTTWGMTYEETFKSSDSSRHTDSSRWKGYTLTVQLNVDTLNTGRIQFLLCLNPSIGK